MPEGMPRKHKRKAQDAMPTHFEQFVWNLNSVIFSFIVLVKAPAIGELFIFAFPTQVLWFSY